MNDLERAREIVERHLGEALEGYAHDHQELIDEIAALIGSIRAECLSMRVELPSDSVWKVESIQKPDPKTGIIRAYVVEESKDGKDPKRMIAYTSLEDAETICKLRNIKLVPSSGALNWPDWETVVEELKPTSEFDLWQKLRSRMEQK